MFDEIFVKVTLTTPTLVKTIIEKKSVKNLIILSLFHTLMLEACNLYRNLIASKLSVVSESDINRFFVFRCWRTVRFSHSYEIYRNGHDREGQGDISLPCLLVPERVAALTSHLSAFDNCQSARRDVDL